MSPAVAVTHLVKLKERLQKQEMDFTEHLYQNRSEILRIAARHGARKVRVFGSVARGEATGESDIDFLVEMEPGRSLFDLGGPHADLEELLGCKVDVVTDGGITPTSKTVSWLRPGPCEE